MTKPYQLWLGNLNKYRVLNGELYSASSLEKLLTEAGTLNQIASGFWDGGTLESLIFNIQRLKQIVLFIRIERLMVVQLHPRTVYRL